MEPEPIVLVLLMLANVHASVPDKEQNSCVDLRRNSGSTELNEVEYKCH